MTGLGVVERMSGACYQHQDSNSNVIKDALDKESG
jgi:hypothetical protein